MASINRGLLVLSDLLRGEIAVEELQNGVEADSGFGPVFRT